MLLSITKTVSRPDEWNNDDEIPGKTNRWASTYERRKELEEESSRFMAARATERQWRWEIREKIATLEAEL